MLFITKTCPNCRRVKPRLDKAGIAYRVVDAEEETELTLKYHLSQVPALIVPSQGAEQVLVGISAILDYVNQHSGTPET